MRLLANLTTNDIQPRARHRRANTYVAANVFIELPTANIDNSSVASKAVDGGVAQDNRASDGIHRRRGQNNVRAVAVHKLRKAIGQRYASASSSLNPDALTTGCRIPHSVKLIASRNNQIARGRQRASHHQHSIAGLIRNAITAH